MDLDYLPLVIEEAAEVVKAAAKIQRFGPDRRYPAGDHAGETNTTALAMEIGDLLEVVGRLQPDREDVARGRALKRDKLARWGPQVTSAELDARLSEMASLHDGPVPGRPGALRALLKKGHK